MKQPDRIVTSVAIFCIFAVPTLFGMFMYQKIETIQQETKALELQTRQPRCKDFDGKSVAELDEFIRINGTSSLSVSQDGTICKTFRDRYKYDVL